MSRQITKTVYKFGELSPEAKERARYKYEASWGGANWDRADEYLGSIKALAEHFGGRVFDYSLDWGGGSAPSDMSFEMPELETFGDDDNGSPEAARERFTRERLNALGSYNPETLRGNGDCKLTGMGYDESAIDGFRAAFIRDGIRDLNELMNAAFCTWIDAAHGDYAYDFGDEGLSENFDANGYEFDEDGNRVKV